MTGCINVCRAAYKETLQKQLKEGTVYFGSQLNSVLHEVVWAEAWVRHCSAVIKQRAMNAPDFSFFSSGFQPMQ